MTSMRRMLRLRLAALVVVPGLTLGLLAGLSNAASAAQVTQLSVPATHGTAATQGPAREAVSQQSTITCTLSIADPHQSGHVPGMVNVVATWSCTSPVSSLSMTVTLYRNGSQVAQGSFANAGKASLKGNAAAPCVSGSYYGTAGGTVVFPPNYEPPSSTLFVQSATVSITC
jgi:hypothetical protein